MYRSSTPFAPGEKKIPELSLLVTQETRNEQTFLKHSF